MSAFSSSAFSIGKLAPTPGLVNQFFDPLVATGRLQGLDVGA
jgi:hypothetical protein